MTVKRRSSHQRKGRGKGYFPPNPRQWKCESNGLWLRDELGVDIGVALPCEAAFSLLPSARVCGVGELALAAEHAAVLRCAGSEWSGMAIQLPDGAWLAVYNDSHAQTRIRATLMEEFFHLKLEHTPSTIRVYDATGKLRTINKSSEREAYESGAAALVPYKSLRQLVDKGQDPVSIAEVFAVSLDMIGFRAKVTKLYRRLFRSAG